MPLEDNERDKMPMQLSGGTIGNLKGHVFQYSVLERDAIRLIRILPCSTPEDIHCILEHHKDYYESGVRYTAISYCWGDPAVTRTINVNGKPFAITTNLWHALSSIILYHDSTELYWADAICLNQSNVEERNHQVHQMWRIYSHAEIVFAWLGPENRSTDFAFRILSQVAASCTFAEPRCQGWRKHHDFPSESVLAGLNSLVNNDFFARTWIIQEYVQAKDLKIVCGRHSVHSDVLCHFQRVWSGSSISELVISRQLHLERTLRKQSMGSYWKRISDVVFSYSRSRCSDRRDRIFALLGDPVIRELDPEGLLEPDYSISAEELALQFLGYCDEIVAGGTTDASESTLSMTANVQSVVQFVIRALELPCKSNNFLKYTTNLSQRVHDLAGLRYVILPSGFLACSGLAFQFLKQRDRNFGGAEGAMSYLNKKLPMHFSVLGVPLYEIERKAIRLLRFRFSENNVSCRQCAFYEDNPFFQDLLQHAIDILRVDYEVTVPVSPENGTTGIPSSERSIDAGDYSQRVFHKLRACICDVPGYDPATAEKPNPPTELLFRGLLFDLQSLESERILPKFRRTLD